MERKVSCPVTNATHVVWICNIKLAVVCNHPIFLTCMEDDQLLLEVLTGIFVVCYVPVRVSCLWITLHSGNVLYCVTHRQIRSTLPCFAH